MALVLDGTLGASAVQDNSVTDTALSLTANSAAIKVALNANNGAPIFACRAWVNFNGTGTVEITASGNVTSITDTGTGSYTVNFTTEMTDNNYACVGIASFSSSFSTGQFGAITRNVGNFVTRTANPSGTLIDSNRVDIAVFR